MIVVSPTLMNSFEIVNPTLTESEISGEKFSDQQIGVRGKTLRGTDGREFTNKLENRGEGAGPSGSPRSLGGKRKTIRPNGLNRRIRTEFQGGVSPDI